ncbi:MAG TPA: hypothetical protein VFY93_04505 [Planctomycetota bacterium]|nr:hypothetical protein [Planctomycetota bacterium]
MARNGTWLVALFVVVVAAAAGADEDLVERWDKPHVESFALKDATPQDVLREIRTRFGVPVGDLALDLPRMDFEAKDVTFLEALDRLAAAHGLLLRGSGFPGAKSLSLARASRKVPPMPVCHVGPSRLSVEGISVLNATHWGDEPLRAGGTDTSPVGLALDRFLNDSVDVPRLRLWFVWMAEPDLEVALVAFAVRRVQYDAGAEASVLDRPGLPIAAGGGFSADLDAPPRSARSIAKLEGRLRVAVPLGQGEVEFKADAWQERKQLGDARVKIEAVDTDAAVVRLSLEGAPCAALKPYFTELDERVRVCVGSDNAKRMAVTVLAYRADGTEIAGRVRRVWSDVNFPTVTYWLALDEAPVRIVLRSTTTARVREAPFSFTDIPLPD